MRISAKKNLSAIHAESLRAKPTRLIDRRPACRAPSVFTFHHHRVSCLLVRFAVLPQRKLVAADGFAPSTHGLAPAALLLSYTAYHCPVCCDIIATTIIYTPASLRHPGSHYRDVCQCVRINSSFQILLPIGSRLIVRSYICVIYRQQNLPNVVQLPVIDC